MRVLTATLGIAVAVAMTAPASAGKRDKGLSALTACLSAIAKEERRRGIPTGLLKAVALAESRRATHPTTGEPLARPTAWPWTINVDGVGSYYPTKAEAMRAAHEAGAGKGVNVDVGCMQISLKHHPDAFDGLSEAFDPAKNVAYSAAFLRKLFTRTGDWAKAVGRYHSSDPVKGARYRARVFARWRELGGAPAAVARAEARDAPVSAGAAMTRTPPKPARAPKRWKIVRIAPGGDAASEALPRVHRGRTR